MFTENHLKIQGIQDLAQAIRIFGYCIVLATVIPAIIIVSFLEGAS